MAEFSKLNGYDVKDKKAIRTYDTIAAMKADTDLKEGQCVKTKGYYSANDGGEGEYIIVNETLTDDGGSIHKLSNGLFASLIVGDYTNVKQFGAYGDGTHDDTTAFQNALNKISNIFISRGTYKVSSVTVPSNRKITGEGYHNSIINFTSSTKGLNIFNSSAITSDVEINHIGFRSSTAQDIVYIHNSYGIILNNCEILDSSLSQNCNGVVIDGTDLSGGVDSPGYYVTINSGRIAACDIGVKLINEANSNLIFNVEIYLCNKSIYIDNSNGNKISYCTLQDILYSGVEIDNTSNTPFSLTNIIVGNYIEGKNGSSTLEAGIKLVNSKVRTTQLLSNKFSNLYSNSGVEVIDNGTDTLRLEYSSVSPSLEPITLPAFVRVNHKPTSYSTAYKNEKLFGCVQMFADDEGSGVLKVLNRNYDSSTQTYSYYWSEIITVDSSNKINLANKTIDSGTLLNANILQYYGKYIKMGTGDLPTVEGALMFDSTFHRPKFYDGTGTKFIQPVSAGSSASRDYYKGYGFMMFDTTLGKPIWYNGSNWVDANGTQV